MKHLGRNHLCGAIILFVCLFLSACAPTLYKQPVSNFKDATEAAKEAYFAQLRSAHDSYIAREKMKLKLNILFKPEYSLKGKHYLNRKQELLNSLNDKAIPEQSLKIRQQAFEALGFYTKTLLALASGDKMDSMQKELEGFSGVMKDTLDSIDKLSDLSTGFKVLSSVSDWAGPLKTAIGVLNGIAAIVGDYLREKAIKESIKTARPMVQQLMATLQKEAKLAITTTKENYKEDIKECKREISFNSFAEPAQRYLVYDMCFNAEIKLSQVPNSDDVVELMEAVSKSHEEMVKVADGGDFDSMVTRISVFYQRVQFLKDKLELSGAQ